MPYTILLTCKEFCSRKALRGSLIKQNEIQINSFTANVANTLQTTP